MGSDRARKINCSVRLDIEATPSPRCVDFSARESEAISARFLIGECSAAVAILAKRNLNLQAQTVAQFFMRHVSADS